MDTINLKYDAEDFPNYDFLRLGNSVPLKNPKTLFADGIMESHFGDLGNLRFKFHRTYFTIKGSWAKYYYKGNNMHPIIRDDLSKAVLNLSKRFKFPFEKGKVTRIDFADTFDVEETPNAYFHLLASCNRMYSNLTKTQLLFTNSLKELAFYDKSAEMMRKNTYAPYRGKRFLRYEMRLINKVSDSLKLLHAPIELFFERQYYDMIIRRWQEEYRGITKLHPNFYDILFEGSQKDIFNQLIPMGLQAYGEKQFNDDLELARKTKAITATEKSRILSALDNLFKTAPKPPRPYPLLKELDELILDYTYPA